MDADVAEKRLENRAPTATAQFEEEKTLMKVKEDVVGKSASEWNDTYAPVRGMKRRCYYAAASRSASAANVLFKRQSCTQWTLSGPTVMQSKKNT